MKAEWSNKDSLEMPTTTMSNYIKREDVLQAIAGLLNVTEQIDGADVVEVVRCKDCKYNPKSDGWVACPMTGAYTRKDGDYCSYGEKK